ncbi:unnamed protein product [Dicrocoelium dendriticum]|nr:unnamed protein product [Dicrocoelium dendriticum]
MTQTSQNSSTVVRAAFENLTVVFGRPVQTGFRGHFYLAMSTALRVELEISTFEQNSFLLIGHQRQPSVSKGTSLEILPARLLPLLMLAPGQYERMTPLNSSTT